MKRIRQEHQRGAGETAEPSKSPSSDKIYPSKRLGQHFLRDRNIISKIVNEFHPEPAETVVEIGPGTGALTAELVKRAGRVVAIEFDRKLMAPLRERFDGSDNFSLVEGDALEVDICEEIKPARSARVVANLPYNISTAILQRLIAQRACIPEMVLMLQREVVDRMLAPAGSSDRGYLSVLVQAYCETERLFDVSPGAFNPPPKVWSSVVRLKLRSGSATNVSNEDLMWEVVSAGFAQKRKTILNNLRNATGNLAAHVKENGGASIVLCKAGIDLQRRAETLTVEEWAQLTNALN